MSRRREKVFGDGTSRPLDRNAKARIHARVHAYNTQHRQPGQHWGPITPAALRVLKALLWDFHNSRDGRCFPSYEAIAGKARCSRDTVRVAIQALEAARLLSWVHRITRIQVTETDVLGRQVRRWRVIRTSNSYVLHDPAPGADGRPGRVSSETENPSGTRIQDSFSACGVPLDPDSSLARALARLGEAMQASGRG